MNTDKRKMLILILLIPVFLLPLSCEKEKMPFEKPEYVHVTDSLTDIEGTVYKTVKIGDQWWMAENLKVRTYRNGNPIYYNSSFTAEKWASLTIGAYCHLYDDPAPTNGRLYNWYAVTNPDGLAPEGWRIPTDDDWKKLELLLGMLPGIADMTGWRGTDEGSKMKVQDRNLAWEMDRDVSNTNESGFSAKPGGCRIYNGYFSDLSQYYTGFWWSSSQANSSQAWYRYLDYGYSTVFRFYAPYTSGFHVRCVKDVN